jgi:hypothetical protein
MVTIALRVLNHSPLNVLDFVYDTKCGVLGDLNDYLFCYSKSDNVINGLSTEMKNKVYDLTRFKPSDSSWFFSIGAHIGSVTVQFAATNPNVNIVVIEPTPATYVYLRWNLIINNLEVFEQDTPGLKIPTRKIIVLNAAMGADKSSFDSNGIRKSVPFTKSWLVLSKVQVIKNILK